MCDECKPDNGISEANQWAEQYFSGLNQQVTQEGFDLQESLRVQLQMLARTEEQERIANAIVVPPGGSPGGNKGKDGLVVPPGGGPNKKKHHPPLIIPPGGAPGEGRGEDGEEPRLYWQWITAGGACEICLDNEAAGPIIQYNTFPSGDVAPPAHPNCRCWLEETNPPD